MQVEDLSLDDMLKTMQEFVGSVTFNGPLPENAEDPEPDLPDDEDEVVEKDEIFYPR